LTASPPFRASNRDELPMLRVQHQTPTDYMTDVYSLRVNHCDPRVYTCTQLLAAPSIPETLVVLVQVREQNTPPRFSFLRHVFSAGAKQALRLI
jgi:hypothetical protein